MKMKTSVNQRRLSIEALENRVVFASDLGIVDAGSMHPQGDGLWHQNEVAASLSHPVSGSGSLHHPSANGALDAEPRATIGPLPVDPNTVSIAKDIMGAIVQNTGSLENFDRQVREQVPEGQTVSSRLSESRVTSSRSGQGDYSPTIVKSSDEILARRWNERKPAGTRTMLASLGSSSEDRRGISWFADRSTDFFSEPFHTIAAPDPIEEPAAHSWSLVFGIAHASSPFAADVGESGRSSIDRATVLEIVANSERAEQPIAEPEATYPNGWKATSIFAAALTAAFYRKKSQEELAPLILAGIRRLRPLSSRR